MPNKDPIKYREYMRTYMLNKYHQRMNEARDRLGGKCIECGSIDNLQLDHIDPSRKEFTVSDAGSWSKDRFDNELEKCQLLCRLCHDKKTLKDLGRLSARENHGTLSSYRYCKCSICKEAKKLYTRKYREIRHSAPKLCGEAKVL